MYIYECIPHLDHDRDQNQPHRPRPETMKKNTLFNIRIKIEYRIKSCYLISLDSVSIQL